MLYKPEQKLKEKEAYENEVNCQGE